MHVMDPLSICFCAGLRNSRVQRRCEPFEFKKGVAIAHHFRVSPTTVLSLIRQARQEGRRSPTRHRGGPAGRLGFHNLAPLQGFVAETNDAYLDQYAERLFARTGKRASRSV